MLNSYIIIIQEDDKNREVFVSPFSLHSKERPQIKSGKIEVLYFYENLRDNKYWAMLEKEVLAEKFKSDGYIINYGQDFGEYYLGSLRIDYDTKRYWQPDKMNEQDANILGKALFDAGSLTNPVIMSTLTRPTDFNFTYFP